jgi:hypothetical protein
MLAVVSGACSIVDSITIYVWTRRASLPRKCQPLNGRGCGNRPATCRLLGGQRRSRRGSCLPKKESAVEQQHRGKGGAGKNSCPTMEVMANAVILSTDRAWTGFEISRARNPSKTRLQWQAGEGNRTLVSSLGSWRSTIELHPRWERGNGDG